MEKKEESLKVWQEAVRKKCGNCENWLDENEDCHNVTCECCNKQTIKDTLLASKRILKSKEKYTRDPFGLSIESYKRVKFFNERLSKYGDGIIESLLLETMDNVYEACGELVGTENMTQERLDEHLVDARMIILRKLVGHLTDEMLKAERESILHPWEIKTIKNDKL